MNRIMRVASFTGVLALSMTAVGYPTLIHARAGVSITEFATGLNDPRGLTFGPDKHLYVAEAGTGGEGLSTVGFCDQVQPPVGPYIGGHTARILRFAPSGGSAIVAAGLPSAEAGPLIGGDKSGVASLAFIGNRLLALTSGAGCSHGHSDADNGVLDISGGHRLTNLSAWLLANPGAKGAETPRNPDYEPDGTWYSLLWDQGRLVAVEPNHGLLVSIHPISGEVGLINDLFQTFGDNTYTALAADRGDLYVGTLGRIVFAPSGVPDFAESFKASIFRMSRDGSATEFADGLRAVLGVAFDQQHRLYALQSPIFVPGTGSLVRRNDAGQWEEIVSGLVFPSALTLGPDGALYISECGYHCAPGQGRVLRVSIP